MAFATLHLVPAAWALALAPVVAARQDPVASRPEADLSPILRKFVASGAVPGIAAAVVDRERCLGLGAAGLRARGADAAVTRGDRFHLGSCTKAMTATLAARLVARGQLEWQTAVPQAFPELADGMDAAWKKVTLERLLTNAAGVPSDLTEGGLWERLWNFEGPPEEARVLLVKELTRRPPVSEPGTKFLYSNAGFAIAGAMAERRAKKPYEALLREHLFAPLGMTSAGFGAPGSKGALDEPRGHRDEAPLEPGPGADNPDAIAPAGKVHANLEDWGKFVSLHLRGEVSGAPPLGLGRETFAKLHRPVLADYAMGWITTERPWAGVEGKGGRVLTHAGSNTQWFAVCWLAPDRGFAVLVACNEGTPAATRACDEAAAALLQFHLEGRSTPK